jgi:hypothetical protein
MSVEFHRLSCDRDDGFWLKKSGSNPELILGKGVTHTEGDRFMGGKVPSRNEAFSLLKKYTTYIPHISKVISPNL